jgi:hypothetical protein
MGASMKPGEEHSAIVYAHEEFSRIPRGRTSLKLTWASEVEGKGKQQVSLKLPVEVLPATPERLAALRRRLEADLSTYQDGKWDYPDGNRANLHRWVYGTWHPALVPVALRLIEKNQGRLDRMLDFTYRLSDTPEAIHARMVALACKPGWSGRVEVFSYWWRRGYGDPPPLEDPEPPSRLLYDELYLPIQPTPLPPKEFAKLLKTRDLWTRILTYVTFPARCPTEWKRALLEECRRLSRPLPARQFAALLRDLDDDDFAVREKASARLEELGERVEGQLRQALKKPLSLEAKSRSQRVLKHIEATPLPPECVPTLHYLANSLVTPQARSVVASLARGDPALRLTREARKALRDGWGEPASDE